MFILGKLCGLAVTLALNVAIMSVVLFGVMYWIGAKPTPAILQAIVLIYVELLIVVSAALTFSSFSTPTLSAIFTLSIWLIGHLAPHLKYFGEHAKDPAQAKLLLTLFKIVPNLDRFNLKSIAGYGDTLSAETFVTTLLLGALYTAFFLGLSSAILLKRDLK